MKLLASTFAFLMFVLAGAAAAEPARTWTGCYGVASAGAGIGSSEVSAGGASVTLSDHGLVAGVAIGCDYQLSQVVVGASAGIDIADVANRDLGVKISADLIYSVAARIGYVPRNDTLFYVRGGGTWTDLSATGFGSQSFTGYFVAGGIDLLLTDHVFLNVEYARHMLDDEGAAGVSVEPSFDIVKVGAGYRF